MLFLLLFIDDDDNDSRTYTHMSPLPSYRYGNGQCWQVDPKGERQPQITMLGGSGGNYESVAVDNRRKRQPIFYVTEDKEYGALRRYIPRYSNAVNMPYVNWDTLHEDGSETTFLVFNDDGRTFEWTTNEQAARNSQARYCPNLEGIDFDDTNGLLYFVSKKRSTLYVLDLLAKTYTSSSTVSGILSGGGEWNHSPDQIVNGKGDYLYFTEDGGKTVGVYVIHKTTGKRYTMFEAYTDRYKYDETTGIAFSPNGKKMYAAFQNCGCGDEASETGLVFNCGCLLEFSRRDGASFQGATRSLKFHKSKS